MCCGLTQQAGEYHRAAGSLVPGGMKERVGEVNGEVKVQELMG